MENLTTYTDYKQFKEELDREVSKTAESFIKIGYLLNIAATTDILLESGYTNVNDMAWNEYHLDPSQTSRFIGIYREYGVEGQPQLQEKFKNHGVAKLGLMLTLPKFLAEEISPDYSKREITAIKREYQAEQQVTDVEVEIEKTEMKESVQYTLPQGLKQAVYQLIHDEPKLYVRIYSSIEMEDFKETLAPMREDTYFVRVKGVGRLAIFVRSEADVTITNLREGTKESYDWQQLFDCFKEYFAMGADAKDSWCNVFQEEWPEEEKKELLKETETTAKSDKDNVPQVKQKKESKVKVVTPKQKKEPEPKVEETAKEVEEQLPGQDNIMNHPEYLPDEMKKEVLTGEVEDLPEVLSTENDNVQQSLDDFKLQEIAPVQNIGTEHAIASLKNMVKASIHVMHDLVEKEDWSMVISKATVVVHNVKKIQDLEEGK